MLGAANRLSSSSAPSARQHRQCCWQPRQCSSPGSCVWWWWWCCCSCLQCAWHHHHLIPLAAAASVKAGALFCLHIVSAQAVSKESHWMLAAGTPGNVCTATTQWAVAPCLQATAEPVQAVHPALCGVAVAPCILAFPQFNRHHPSLCSRCPCFHWPMHHHCLFSGTQLLPSVQHGWLIQEVSNELLDTAAACGFEMLCPRANALTAEGVALIKSRGLVVRAWGVKTIEVRCNACEQHARRLGLAHCRCICPASCQL